MNARIDAPRSVSEYALALHDRQWVANHDGNVSMRRDDGFLITPTGISKRVCFPETIVACNAQGTPIGRGRPPSEVALHKGAYEARAAIGAVIHAHPPYASAYALAQRSLSPQMPEVVVSIGPFIPVLPRMLPKDPSAAQVLSQAMRAYDVVLLAGNGVLTVGPDLETAYLRLELIEHYARILSIAESSAGAPAPLTADELDRLVAIRKKAGLHLEAAATVTPARGDVAIAVREVVAEEVRRALKGDPS